MNNQENKATPNLTYLGKLVFRNEKLRGEAWYRRHREALLEPRNGLETCVGILLKGWLGYADEHAFRYQSGIGQDGVLAAHWAAIGYALRGLLNGETGRLDCGLLDGLLCDTLKAEGCEE